MTSRTQDAESRAGVERLLLEAEPVIRSVVRKRLPSSRSSDFDDLCQFSRIRVWQAAESFDPLRCRWSRYAARVTGYAVVDWVRKNGFVKRVAFKLGYRAPATVSISSAFVDDGDARRDLCIVDPRSNEADGIADADESFDWLASRVPVQFRESIVKHFRDSVMIKVIGESLVSPRTGRHFSKSRISQIVSQAIGHLRADDEVRKRYHHINRRFFDEEPEPAKAVS